METIEIKQYAITYFLSGALKIDVTAALSEIQLQEFMNTFSNGDKPTTWMLQHFESGKYLINIDQVILVEIKVVEPVAEPVVKEEIIEETCDRVVMDSKEPKPKPKPKPKAKTKSVPQPERKRQKTFKAK